MSEQHEEDLADAKAQADLTGVVTRDQAHQAVQRMLELAADIDGQTELIKNALTVVKFLDGLAG